MLAIITAALALTTPLSCVQNAPAWAAVQARYNTVAVRGSETAAFYLPRSQGGPRVFIGPQDCRALRELTRKDCDRPFAYRGVWVLAHELEHARQDRQHRPFSEQQADRVGHLRAPGMLRKLEHAFGHRCQ